MTEIYFNVFKKIENNSIVHLFSPFYYDFINPPISIDLGTINPYADNIHSKRLGASELLFNYIRTFPGRTVKTIKINYNDNRREKFMAYTINLSHVNEEWYGISLIIGNKEDLPLKHEIDLSDQVYNSISDDLKNENFNSAQKELENLLLNYKPQSKCENADDCEKKEHFLEERVIPNEDSLTKWDFFLMKSNGEPLTREIFRYKGFSKRMIGSVFKLDMNNKYNLDGYTPDSTLNSIHELNCTGLSAFYLACGVISRTLELNNASPRHMTMQLSNCRGFGFTFIDDLIINGTKIILALDVKNKIHSTDEKYACKLFGNERERFNHIKELIQKEILRVPKLGTLNERDNESVFQCFNKAMRPEIVTFI